MWIDGKYLLRTEQIEQFSEIMDKSGDLHPFGLAVSADCLRGLQKVLYL